LQRFVDDFADLVKEVGREIGVVRPRHRVNVVVDDEPAEKGGILQRLKDRAG
jgi:hypothetical protein